THTASGVTMVPLNGNPVAMNVTGLSYPQASDSGAYTYQKTVSLSALQQAFGETFNGDKLDLASRVIYIHGVPATTKLPASVSSLPGAPAQITLPIACGAISASPKMDPSPTS